MFKYYFLIKIFLIKPFFEHKKLACGTLHLSRKQREGVGRNPKRGASAHGASLCGIPLLKFTRNIRRENNKLLIKVSNFELFPTELVFNSVY